MFCTRCGTSLDSSARYCVACGKATFSAPESPAPEFPGERPAGAPPQLPPPGNKRLHRILADKKIAGVCAGYAEYFAMDLTLMRLIWIGLLLVPPHIGLIGYLISWAVLPKSELPVSGI